MRVNSSSPSSLATNSKAAQPPQKAVIDRLEKTANGKTVAVLLVGNEERIMSVSLRSLPKGVREGDWLQVQLKGGKLLGAKADPKETEARRKQNQDLFDSVFEGGKPIQKKAVIDRFEKLDDGRVLAVLLVGDEEKTMNVAPESLPPGAMEGDWLEVNLQGDDLVSARIDPKETEDRRSRIQKLFDSLFS